MKGLATHRHVSLLLRGKSFVRLSGLIARHYASFNVRGRGVPKSKMIANCNVVNGQLICIFTRSFAIFKKTLSRACTGGVYGIVSVTVRVNTPVVKLGSSKNTHVRRKIHSLTKCTRVFLHGSVTSKMVPRVDTVVNPYTNNTICSPTLASFVLVIGGSNCVFVAKPSMIEDMARRRIDGRRLNKTTMRASVSKMTRLTTRGSVRYVGCVHRLVSFLPKGGVRRPPFITASSSPAQLAPRLSVLMPAGPGRPCGVGRVVRTITSSGDFFRLRTRCTTGVIVNCVHLGKGAIKIITGRPLMLTNALSVSTSIGTTHFIHFYSTFGVPLLALISMPKFLPKISRRCNNVVHGNTGLLCTCYRTAMPGIAIVAHGTCNNTCSMVDSGRVQKSIGFTFPATRVTIVKPSKTIGVLFHGRVSGTKSPRRGQGRLRARCHRGFTGPCQTTRLNCISRIVSPAVAHVQLVHDFRVLTGGHRSGPPGGRSGLPLWCYEEGRVVVGGVLMTGHNRVTVHVFHAYQIVGVTAMTVCAQMSHKTLRIHCTRRTCYVSSSPRSASCLGPRGVLRVTGGAKTTVRPNCNFLSRGTSFTHHYRRRKIVFVNPDTSVVTQVNVGARTQGVVERTNLPVIPNARRPIRNVTRTGGMTTRINCPVVLGTLTNNNKGKVQLIHSRRRIRVTLHLSRSRTKASFKGSTICVRGCVRGPRRVRIRVLNSGCKGMVRLCRHRYSVRQQGRGMVRRSPSPFIGRRAQGQVLGITMRTYEGVKCCDTKALRFVVSGSRGFCFLRVGAQLRMRRPMARRYANISLMHSVVLITTNGHLPCRRRSVRFENTTVRYHVCTRSPRGGFVPSPKIVAIHRTPRKHGIHLSDTTCTKFRISLRCSPVVTGLYY